MKASVTFKCDSASLSAVLAAISKGPDGVLSLETYKKIDDAEEGVEPAPKRTRKKDAEAQPIERAAADAE